MAKPGDKEPRWLPLESNPDVMNKYLTRIGVPGHVNCVDVYGLDPNLLAMVPSPAYAMFLLFPTAAVHKEAVAKKVEGLKTSGYKAPADVFFMEQRIHNACGTFALIHGLANNVDKLALPDDASFKKFYEATRNLSPAERSKKLEDDERMTVAHEESAQEGQTSAPRPEDEVDYHFVCFVHKGGVLYELDGRAPFPLSLGKTDETNFLKDAGKACKEYMDRAPGELKFTMIALATSD